MHAYATNSKERVNVIFLITLFSILLWLGSHELLLRIPKYENNWSGLLHGPSIAAIFLIIYRLFNVHIWKWNVWRKIGLVKIPNLNGRWYGFVKSSYNSETKYNVSQEIKQNWTHMSIHFATEKARSHSFTGSVLVDQPEGEIIHYAYRCFPVVDADPTMGAHRGTTIVILIGNNKLEGQYYTSGGRENVGYVQLMRE